MIQTEARVVAAGRRKVKGERMGDTLYVKSTEVGGKLATVSEGGQG